MKVNTDSVVFVVFVGHVVGSRPMKRKENLHRIIVIFNQQSCN